MEGERERERKKEEVGTKIFCLREEVKPIAPGSMEKRSKLSTYPHLTREREIEYEKSRFGIF